MTQTNCLIRKNNIDEFIKYLSVKYKDAKCQLIYNKDYELLIATMLSARVSDNQVNKVTKILFDKYDSIEKLKNADIAEIEKIVKPLGMYKIKSKNIIEISKYVFEFGIPDNRDELMKLPGVGIKVANVVLAEIFKQNYMAVDTHVHRILTRFKIINENDSPLKIEEKINSVFKGLNLNLLNHQIIEFGREICKSNNPKCESCPFCKN